MTDSRRRLIRMLLAAMATQHVVTGLTMTLGPLWFYENVLGVAELGPYNEHLLVDLGAMNLGLGLLATWAAVTMSLDLVRASCCCIAVVALAHLMFHAAHLHGLSGLEAAVELTALAAIAVLPTLVSILARTRPSA